MCFHKIDQAQSWYIQCQFLQKPQVGSGKQFLVCVKQQGDSAHCQGPVVLSTGHENTATYNYLLLLQTDQSKTGAFDCLLIIRHSCIFKQRRKSENFAEIPNPSDSCGRRQCRYLRKMSIPWPSRYFSQYWLGL